MSLPVATPPAKPLPTQAPSQRTIGQQAAAAYGPRTGARADLIYGDTNSTKTSRLGDIAEWVRKRYGQKSRLISADPGGWEPIEHLVQDGTIEAFALVQHRVNLYETMERLTLGFWPKDARDPQSPLVPPGENGMKDVGAILIEGLTSWCDLMMRTNLTDLQNINVPRSEAEKMNSIKSGTFVHRFASQTDYGSVQDIIAEMVRNSGMLPVRKVCWTATETTGEDEQKKPVYGPDLIGKKATGRCGPWFGNLIHLDFIPVNKEQADPVNPVAKIIVQQPMPFMFLRSHIDPLDPFKRPWPAKTRAPKTLWAEVPNVMKPDMGEFYELMDSLLQREAAARTAAK